MAIYTYDDDDNDYNDDEMLTSKPRKKKSDFKTCRNELLSALS